MHTIKKHLISPPSVSILSLIWFGIVSFFIFKDWNPLTLHPLSLFSKEMPLLPYDIAAAVIKLFSGGMCETAYLFIIALAAIGSGNLALRLLRLTLNPGQRIILSLALGLGILSYYTFFLGVAGGFNKTGLCCTYTILALFSLYGALYLLKSLKNSSSPRITLIYCCFIGIFIITMLFLFAKALWPAVFYDAITYHLGVPNYYVLEGNISYIPYDSCASFPFMGEMLYTLGIFLSGPKLAQLINVFIFFCIIVTVYNFAGNIITNTIPAIPALLCLATPAFMDISVCYTNDLFLAYYTLLFIYSYFMWEKQMGKGCMILVWICGGLCLGIKYIALTYIPVFLILFTLILWKKNVWKSYSKTIIIGFITCCLISAPYFIKNLLCTGNPFYPAFYGVLGGRDMNSEMYASIVAMGGHATHLIKNFEGLKILINSLLSKCEIISAGTNIGPLILIYAPLLLVMKKINPSIKKLCIAALIIFVLWNIAFLQVRYLYAGVVLALIISGYALSRIVHDSPYHFRIFIISCAAFIILICLAMGFYMVNSRTKTYGVDFINDTDEKYLLKHMVEDQSAVLHSYPAYQYINQNLSPNAVVLIIGDSQHLYIKRKHRYTYLSATTPYDIFKNMAGKHVDIAKSLKKEGITHLVYNPSEMSRMQKCGAINYKKEDNKYIEDFLKSSHVTSLYTYTRGAVSVYLFALP
jgi:hypothetical protein